MKAVFILFFACRTVFGGMNPVAVALFYLTYYKKKKRSKEIIAVVCGVFSATILGTGDFSLYDAAKYLMIFGCISFVDRVAMFYKVYLRKEQLLYVSAAITFFISLCGDLLVVKEAFLFSVCEGMLVVVFAHLLERGVSIVTSSRKIVYFSNEQLLSIILLLVIATGGIYEPLPERVLLSESILYLLILYMAKKYGAAAGAMAGVAAGVLCGIRGNEVSFIGLFCLIGISVGMVCRMGKWICLSLYILSGMALALMYPDELWNVTVLKAYIAAAVSFAFIPSAFLAVPEEEDDFNSENGLISHNMKTQLSERLAGFAGAFEKLSVSFGKECAPVAVYAGANRDMMFNDITEAVCKDCIQCSNCWQNHYYDTYHETLGIISLGDSGRIRPADIPDKFATRCIHVDEFMREVNKQLEIARVNIGWMNRYNRNRMMVVRQMKEISSLIGGLEKEIISMTRVQVKHEEEMIVSLRRIGIKVRDIVAVRKNDSEEEFIIKMRALGKRAITYREIAGIVTSIQGEKWIVDEKYGNTLPNEYKDVVFIKDVKYRILTGVARTAKEGENISGDNYSFIRLSGGKVIMTITDGMGSGISAYEESEKAIELLEEFVQAGFREDMALRLINSSLLLDDDKDDFSTVDICVINLHTAVCRFVKCGAPAAFIRKKDYVKVVSTETMPVGIMPEINTIQTSHKLSPGDFVIMLSDGITDSFAASSEDNICELIQSIKTDNPQELADMILSEVMNTGRYHAKDDMSVLVAGIWAKNT